MKKIKLLALELLLCILMSIIILSSCNQAPQKKSHLNSAKFDTILNGASTSFYSVYSSEHYISGMKYRIFNSFESGLFVVNVTKDSLECVIDSMIIAEKRLKLK